MKIIINTGAGEAGSGRRVYSHMHEYCLSAEPTGNSVAGQRMRASHLFDIYPPHNFVFALLTTHHGFVRYVPSCGHILTTTLRVIRILRLSCDI
jgi:hypothetical protein